jgi:2-polyprenyl-3-methyl-5-hydroxy-6-metoxy-1,4-benzoquinol methylase
VISQAPFWNQKYERSTFVYGKHPNAFLTEVAPGAISPAGHVLSLGEGEGRNAVWMARQGWQVTAVDYSSRALEKLQQYATESDLNIETHCRDVVDFDFGRDLWDAIVILHIHLLPAERRSVHRRAAQALRPRGVIVLEALRPEQLDQPTGGPESSLCLYTPDDLWEDFRALDIELIRAEDRYIEAGEHRGMTSVVSLLARRPGLS